MKLFKHCVHPLEIHASIILADLKNIFIGELCDIQRSAYDESIVGRSQVLGFKNGHTLLSLIGSSSGLSLDVILIPTGKFLSIPVGSFLLGCVLNATGDIIYSFKGDDEVKLQENYSYREIDSPAPKIMTRQPINELFLTGIKPIDGLLSVGKGQRMGIFAPAGAGKTSLMNMLITHAEADVFIVALIGERGREVREFIYEMELCPRKSSIIIVYSTSDSPAIERYNAANIATTLAEYFRDQGLHAVLFMDSMTRYARSLRDVALASGEPPARRGYPASVFEKLPMLLERPGCTSNGVITAFYTVLLENEDEPDPIGDEIRSIIDGHIYLNYQLSGKGHYPAIDILKSISRVFNQVVTTNHRNTAEAIRDYLAILQEMQIYLDLGEYTPGINEKNDIAFNLKDNIYSFLKQEKSIKSPLSNTLRIMHEIVSKGK